jgi:hypothetical protein
VAGSLIDPRAGLADRLRALPRIAAFYAGWYPRLWLGWSRWPRFQRFGALSGHLGFIERSSRRLARQIFHAMNVYRGGLQRRQAFLFRSVDIAIELTAMTVSVARAEQMRRDQEPQAEHARELADFFCREARRRVRDLFRALWRNDDVRAYRLGQEVLRGSYRWLEEAALGLGLSADALRPVRVSDLPRSETVEAVPEAEAVPVAEEVSV